MRPAVLPLPAIHALIRHLDAVDKLLSSRMMHSRPHTETSLTQSLGSMLDEETQAEFSLEYTLAQLNADLSTPSNACTVRITLETHQYATGMENKVTQSDLGLVLKYEDRILPQHSFEQGALLQAKRLSPRRTTGLNPAKPDYREASGFASVDTKQEERIQKLRKEFGDFLSYLLFCPRPSQLPSALQKKLGYLRDAELAHGIFDYALGLELRDDLLSDNPTTAAGIWVGRTAPKSLAEVHADIFHGTTPFSWWLLERAMGHRVSLGSLGPRDSGRGHLEERGLNTTRDPLALKLIRGGQDKRDEILERLGVSKQSTFQLFPPHTLTIEIGAGLELPPDDARLDANLKPSGE